MPAASNSASANGRRGYAMRLWLTRAYRHGLAAAGVQAPVVGEFLGVHTAADDMRLRNLVGQVAHPAAHEVENGPAGGGVLAVELCDGGDRGVVDVRHETRDVVEQRVRRLVD